jgi:enoyl-CoA hydratase/carnithine racemase
MSESNRVLVSIDAQGIAEVVLNRADKLNALDPAMFEAINDALARLEHETKLRAVVVRGEGRAFSAGLDVASFGRMTEGSTGVGPRNLLLRTHGLANAPQHVAWGWRELPVPVIAAVHGVAYGGGLQIALGADVRIVTPDAKLCVAEIKWGLVPDMAGCVFMTELLRTDVARELTFSGRIVTGTEAQIIGLATRVSTDPLGEARALAAQIASSNPDAIRAAKRLINSASPVRASEVLQAESVEQQRLIGSPNQVEAVRAAMEQRPPQFT